VQLPCEIKNPDALFNESQDVDGFINPNITPCTPKGIIDYLAYCGYTDFSGQTVLIINRSDIVGRPLAKLFLDRNATTIVAHSKTKNLQNLITAADIIVTAVGKPNFITKDMIRDNQIVIDVGITFDENGKLCGDCERGMGNNVTPVPGGVGLLTRVALLENILAVNSPKDEVFEL
jgi:methylenetetrahydrofolate dehydrogenase (NADP+)/methenyltetrahydrofolate cyclohydrolase